LYSSEKSASDEVSSVEESLVLAQFPERFVPFFAIFLFLFLFIFHNAFPLPDLSGSVDELDD
jgi:hypothetical protein